MDQSDASVPFCWIPAYGEAIESLNNSRNVLETILEETSDDEGSAGKWENMNSFEWISSNSESQTNSVIGVDLNQDSETLSERDFMCPAKRRKQDNEIFSDNVLPRRSNSDGERYRVFEPRALLDSNEIFTKRIEPRFRFDEIGLTAELNSDSDSLSYNSLSRSSSLIQFEFLERQLLFENQQYSGSSPALSTDTSLASPIVTNKATINNLNEFERLLKRNANQLINATNSLQQQPLNINQLQRKQLANIINHQNMDSDHSSETYSSVESTSSSFSSEESYYLNHSDKNSDEEEEKVEREAYSGKLRAQKYLNENNFIRRYSYRSGSSCKANNVRNKNSVESLSEDSGFCDQGLNHNIRVKSKSDPTLNVLENGHYTIINTSVILDDDACYKSMDDLNSTRRKLINNSPIKINNIGITKIAVVTKRTDVKNSKENIEYALTFEDEQNFRNERENSRQKPVISISSPDLLTDKNYFYKNKQDFCHVSSVPDYINLCGITNSIDGVQFNQDISSNSITSHTFDTFCLNLNDLSIIHNNPCLTASYANLTLLNYSDDTMAGFFGLNNKHTTEKSFLLLDNTATRDTVDQQQKEMQFSNRKYATSSSETTKSEFNSFLEEFSAHFDKNLSILNDRHENYDPTTSSEIVEQPIIRPEPEQNHEQVAPPRSRQPPPLPPPRKSSKNKIVPVLIKPTPDFKTNAEDLAEHDCTKNYESEIAVDKLECSTNNSMTFDQDPTNLNTCYAISLERCNFDTTEHSNIDLVNIRTNMASSIIKGNHELSRQTNGDKKLIVSTPNLNRFDTKLTETMDFEHYNSLKDITIGNQKQGILNTSVTGSQGSKHTLSKGVSFCPIVSEISWQETHGTTDEDSTSSIRSSTSTTSSSSDEYCPNTAYNNYNEDEDELNALDVTDSSDINPIQCCDFGEYLLPVKTHTFKTMMTIMIDDDSFKHETNKMNLPIVAEIHDSVGDNNNVFVGERWTDTYNTVTNQPVLKASTKNDSINVNNNSNRYNNNVNEINTNVETDSVKMYTDEKRSSGETSSHINIVNDECNNQKNINSQITNSNKKNNNILEINTNINESSNDFTNSDSTHKVMVANLMTNKNNSVEKILNNKTDVHKLKKKDGLLSRISSGLRFSFRSKKSSINKGTDATDINNENSDALIVNSSDYKRYNAKSRNNQDIIFIPLKDPTKQNVESFITHEIEHHLPNDNNKHNNNHMLHKKPPLPKQPPRAFVTGRPPLHPNATLVCTHQSSGVEHAHTKRATSISPSKEQPPYHDIVPSNQLRSATLKAYHADIMSAADDCKNIGSKHKMGLIETNLDTHETIISGKTQSLLELGAPAFIHEHHNKHQRHTVARGVGIINGTKHLHAVDNAEHTRPHKSMEFLLDKDNQQQVMPPENELQKSHETNTNLSEHQLRVQASLQRLNVPDWYKNYNSGNRQASETTGILRKRNSDVGRWTGLSSKTTSLSSLGSQRSDRSPIMLSPSAHSHHGQTGFSRWSTSHLNSNQTSPSVSTRSSFTRGILTSGYQNSGNTLRGSYRQPYLGWRSQEKLMQGPLRTPAERLAYSLLQQKQQQLQNKPPKPPRHTPPPVMTPEIKDEIKEVTSAIVHYVNDQTSRNSRSRSTSPSQRCWLESSFVGTKPLESPQTPVIDNTAFASHASSAASSLSRTYPAVRITADHRINGTVTIPTFQMPPERPTSATLLDDIDVEDVLVNLLGLPANSRPEDTANELTSQISLHQEGKLLVVSNVDAQNKQQLQVEQTTERRRSEGDTHQKNRSNNPEFSHQRKLSLDSFEAKNIEIVRCRNPKCDATTTPAEAKKLYKSCHNCSHLYCSRECRRSHWEKHRKACLHSRVSALCRQVLSACKDDADTLRHLSLLARKGFLSQGRGVIRILFRSPENADIFIKQGFQCLGEVTYVRWPDLMPAEMGPELYSELLRLSTEYKPESKMLLYVAICVVSEAPASTGQVKWERQLVSRCAKLKLCKTIINDMAHQQPIFTQAQSSSGMSPNFSNTASNTTTAITANATPNQHGCTYINI